MAVCSTLSSEFSAALPEDVATLLKFLLTWTQKQIDEHLNKQVLLRALCCKKRIACIPLVMQCSAGSSLFFSKPWRTERTEGLWTSCSTNKCDWKGSGVVTEVLVKSIFNVPCDLIRSCVLTQQQAVTVIWIVFLPGWQTCFKCRGL